MFRTQSKTVFGSVTVVAAIVAGVGLGASAVAYPALTLVAAAAVSLLVAMRAAVKELRRTVELGELQLVRVSQPLQFDSYRLMTTEPSRESNNRRIA